MDPFKLNKTPTKPDHEKQESFGHRLKPAKQLIAR